MNKNTRNLTTDELRAVLQKHYRQFITGVSIRAFADGRLYVAVEFADSGNGGTNDTGLTASGNG